MILIYYNQTQPFLTQMMQKIHLKSDQRVLQMLKTSRTKLFFTRVGLKFFIRGFKNERVVTSYG